MPNTETNLFVAIAVPLFAGLGGVIGAAMSPFFQDKIFRHTKTIESTTSLLDIYAKWIEVALRYLDARRTIALLTELDAVPLGDARSEPFAVKDMDELRSRLRDTSASFSQLTSKLLLLEPDQANINALRSLTSLWSDSDTSFGEHVVNEIQFLDEYDTTQQTIGQIRDRARDLHASKLYP